MIGSSVTPTSLLFIVGLMSTVEAAKVALITFVFALSYIYPEGLYV